MEIEQLTQLIQANPTDEHLRLERGKRHWQQSNIPACFADYDAAIALNPNSPAKQLKAMALQILEFYNRDMYNP